MEQAKTPDVVISHDCRLLTPEQVALEALVDELYKRSDARAFLILNKIAEEAEHEREN